MHAEELWIALTKEVETAPLSSDTVEVPTLFTDRYPLGPLRIGEREFFPALEFDDDLAWPETWFPLEALDHITLVLAEGKVWQGYREGRIELSPEPLWESLEAFLEDALHLSRHAAFEDDEGDRFLTSDAEAALRDALESPDESFEFFRVATRASRLRYLEGEVATARVVTIAGLFFLACAAAFLFAPFKSLMLRVPFVVVIGCVPFAIAVYGANASAKARRRLRNLTREP
ncbi:MAG: hypothetical protein AAGE52_17330 [Myxococcota bacterium]